MKKNLPRILFLYPNEWDRQEIARAGLGQEFEIVFEGFDRYSILKRLNLALFDPLRFIDRMVAQYRGEIQGVASNDDHWGALLAALIAKELNLPGLDPQVLVTCQHKALFREAERDIFRQGATQFEVIEPGNAAQKIPALAYPVFIKPVKSSFSVLARRVSSAEEMRQATRFHWYERLSQHVALRSVEIMHRHVIGKEKRLPSLRSFIAETPLSGCQVNVDGFAIHGEIHILGVIDAVMYPDTHAFKRFEYPSQLSQQGHEAVVKTVKALLHGLSYRHGFFNVEVFVKPADSPEAFQVRVIEVNPRMARQLTSIYQDVNGFDCWQALFHLACGLDVKPAASALQGLSKHAASFVRRSFDGRLPELPSATMIESARTLFPDARLQLYLKSRGFGKSRELKWVGSYRYAVTNLSAASRAELFQRYEALSACLGWASEYSGEGTSRNKTLDAHDCAQATAK